MRDGSSQDSPLMGRFCGNGSNVTALMQTTQNHLWIRLEENALILKYNTQAFFVSLRFFSNYFASGFGFQLEYKSTNVSHSKWSYMVDECRDDGYFSTTGGILASPSYPDYYPDNADCIYTISQPTGTVILLNFFSMDMEYDDIWCGGCCDYLEIRDGPSDDSPLLGKLCGSDIPAPIQSTQNQLRMK